MSSRNNILIRAATSLLLLVASVVVPWWVLFLLVAVNSFLYSWFMEGVLVVWLLDVVFAVGLFPWLTVGLLAGLLVVEGVKYYSFYR